MSKKEIIEGTAEVVVKHLPKTTSSIDNVVCSIVDIFDTLLAPFQALKIYKDAKIKELKDGLEKKIKQIPEEDLKDGADLNVIGPALEALKYTFMNDELREMFENLLASSIDKRKCVFPSFADIIRQLNSDEAKLLKYFSKHGKDYPLVDLHYVLENGKGYREISVNFSNIGYGLLENPEMISAYLNDLNRFGLIDIPSGVYLTNDELYHDLENHQFIAEKKNMIFFEKGKFEIKKKKMVITDYGLAFFVACINNEGR